MSTPRFLSRTRSPQETRRRRRAIEQLTSWPGACNRFKSWGGRPAALVLSEPLVEHEHRKCRITNRCSRGDTEIGRRPLAQDFHRGKHDKAARKDGKGHELGPTPINRAR